MTEDDARTWFVARLDGNALNKLEQFADTLVVENDQQNLVAPSTIPTLWSRHLLDSAQLHDFAPPDWQHWVDIGSGAGLPGIVIAILTGRMVTLVEPRRLRVEFLEKCCDMLQLDTVTVLRARAETADIAEPVDVISARAVAKLDVLLSGSRAFATKATTYVLPKGESAQSEVAAVRRSWQGVFHVKQSIVDPKSGIVVASGVARR